MEHHKDTKRSASVHQDRWQMLYNKEHEVLIEDNPFLCHVDDGRLAYRRQVSICRKDRFLSDIRDRLYRRNGNDVSTISFLP